MQGMLVHWCMQGTAYPFRWHIDRSLACIHAMCACWQLMYTAACARLQHSQPSACASGWLLACTAAATADNATAATALYVP
jgi:hypothetical protein